MQKDIENAYVGKIYNQSVTEIHKGAYQEAEQIITEGLNSYPDNMQLLRLHSKLLQIQSELG